MALCFALGSVASAQERTFASKKVHLHGVSSVSRFIAEIEKQTGNRVVDQRAERSDRPVQIPTSATTFWQALDALGQQTGIASSPYREAEAVTLLDRPYRKVSTGFSDFLRVSVRQVQATRDEETANSLVTLHVEIAWEPRLQPFFLSIQNAKVRYAAGTLKPEMEATAETRGDVSVAGRVAIEQDLRFKAPDRSSPRIVSFTGDAILVGPVRMVPFTFAQLKPGAWQETRDGDLVVRVGDLKRDARSWRLTVDLERPEGEPVRESFQNWLENNRIHLERAKPAKIWRPIGEEASEGTRRTRVVYAFEPNFAAGDWADWTLHYRAAGRVISQRVPFRIVDILLP